MSSAAWFLIGYLSGAIMVWIALELHVRRTIRSMGSRLPPLSRPATPMPRVKPGPPMVPPLWFDENGVEAEESKEAMRQWIKQMG